MKGRGRRASSQSRQRMRLPRIYQDGEAIGQGDEEIKADVSTPKRKEKRRENARATHTHTPARGVAACSELASRTPVPSRVEGRGGLHCVALCTHVCTKRSAAQVLTVAMPMATAIGWRWMKPGEAPFPPDVVMNRGAPAPIRRRQVSAPRRRLAPNPHPAAAAPVTRARGHGWRWSWWETGGVGGGHARCRCTAVVRAAGRGYREQQRAATRPMPPPRERKRQGMCAPNAVPGWVGGATRSRDGGCARQQRATRNTRQRRADAGCHGR